MQVNKSLLFLTFICILTLICKEGSNLRLLSHPTDMLKCIASVRNRSVSSTAMSFEGK